MQTENNENNNENLDNQNNETSELEQLRAANAQLKSQFNEVVTERDKVLGKNKDLINENGGFKEKLNNFNKIASDEEDKENLKTGNVEALINKKLSSQQSQFDEIINGLTSEKENLVNKVLGFENQIKKNDFEKKALDYISKTDIKKSAINMFLRTAMQDAEIENGEFVFKDANGNIKHNNKGKRFDFNDYIEESRTTNDFFFEVQEGTNAPRGGSNNGVKTYTVEEWQGMMIDASPEEEAKLEALYNSGKVNVEG